MICNIYENKQNTAYDNGKYLFLPYPKPSLLDYIFSGRIEICKHNEILYVI